jgi:molybdate transport system substrate-binding protein
VNKVALSKSQKLAGLLAALALTVGLPGCSTASGSAAGSSHAGDTLTVFAAASLKASFTQLAKTYETGHPGHHRHPQLRRLG